MTESWTTKETQPPESFVARDLLTGLSMTSGLPDLKELALRLAAQVAELDSAGGWAVALPHPGAGLLEPGWGRVGNNCLIQSGAGVGPTWSTVPDNWKFEGKSSRLSEGAGTGPWPEDWPLPSDTGQWSWQQLTFCLSNQTALALLVVHPATDQAAHEIQADLQRIQSVLEPLLEVWATARGMESELGQARTENQALSRLNSLQEKIVAMASHEFKTPLTSIMAYTDALRGQVTDAEFPHATEFLGVIRTEAGRLLRMANRILDFSRMGAGLEMLEVLPTNVETLVSDAILAIRPAVATKGLHLETNLEPGLARAEIDADLIRQVLVNLLSNAVKYTPEGGNITVSAEEVEASVRISVADTGLGIPTEDLQRIFREFYRTKGQALREEGTGLGLTIVRNIMNLHGSFIDVSRRAEGGTDFSCYLPKEMKAPASLPLQFVGRTDRDKAWRLVTLLGYLAAELTGSRSVEIQLENGSREMVTVAAMGPAADQWLMADLGTELTKTGVLRVGCPLNGESYGQATVAQLQVIAEMTALALSYLTPDSPTGDGASSSAQVAKVTDAVRSVLQIRRSGIPTSTARALDLLKKLGRKLGIDAGDIRRLQYAALLHDAGMARVEVEIVMGESELSWDQRDEVDRHVEQGVDLMAPLLPDPDVVMVIRHHHERFDGQGYPDGLRGEEIPLGARLLAVVDTWFALTRDRTFRHGLPYEEALQEIKNHAGTQFDPDVVNGFEKVLKGEGIIPGSPAPSNNRPG